MTQQEFLALGRRITDNQLPYKVVNRATIKILAALMTFPKQNI